MILYAVFVGVLNLLLGFLCAMWLGKLSLFRRRERVAESTPAVQHDSPADTESRHALRTPEVASAGTEIPAEDTTSASAADADDVRHVASKSNIRIEAMDSLDLSNETFAELPDRAIHQPELPSDMDDSDSQSISPAESLRNLEGELHHIQGQLEFLRLNPDRKLIQVVAQGLSSVLRAHSPIWMIEIEQASSDDEQAEPAKHLENAVAQAETTCTNIDNIDWDDDIDEIINQVETELSRLQRVATLTMSPPPAASAPAI